MNSCFPDLYYLNHHANLKLAHRLNVLLLQSNMCVELEPKIEESATDNGIIHNLYVIDTFQC